MSEHHTEHPSPLKARNILTIKITINLSTKTMNHDVGNVVVQSVCQLIQVVPRNSEPTY
jgi:hypothetical protein